MPDVAADPATSPDTAVDTYDTVEEILRAHFAASIGGWRGALESALPTVAFAIAWARTADLRLSFVASAAVIVVALVLRLIQRQPTRYIGYAAFGLAISAFFALRSGRAEDAFAPGMIWNAVTATAMLLSNLANWPALGFIIGAGDPATTAEDPFAWHRHRPVVQIAKRLTWVFIGLWVVRLSIMVPLYVSEQITALATAKVLLGWPAYLVTIAIMGAMLMRGRTPLGEMAHENFARRLPPR